MASLSQICPDGPFTKPVHGHKYGVQWAPHDDCDNCWVQVGSHDRCNTYQELYGRSPSWGQDEEEIKPWAKHITCVSQTSDEPRDEIPKISKMIELMDANDRLIQAHEANLHKTQVHLRLDDYLAGSYLVRLRLTFQMALIHFSCVYLIHTNSLTGNIYIGAQNTRPFKCPCPTW